MTSLLPIDPAAARDDSERPGAAAVAILLLAIAVGGLVAYKASSALTLLGRVQGGAAVAPKAEWIVTGGLAPAVRPFAGTINYLSWVGIALAFGVVIGGLVRGVVPERWMVRWIGRSGWRGELVAAASGAPLMLCSCCVAPVFEAVFSRTRRLGPSLALMLAAPALNPAVLAVTFLVFPASIAWGRLIGSLLLAVAGAGILGRLLETSGDGVGAASCRVEPPRPGAGVTRSVLQGMREVAVRTLPSVVLGVLLSAVVMGLVPVASLATTNLGAWLTVLLATAVALPLALPTFGEIPLALALSHAGAPDGAVLAFLLAGPAINLPSLFTLGRSAGLRAAAATGALVYLVAVAGGLLLG